MFWHRLKQLKTWFLKGKHQLTWLQAALLAPPTINPHPLHLNSQVWKSCFSIYKWISLSLLVHFLASSGTKEPQTWQVFPDMNSSSVYWCSARTLPERDHHGCGTVVLWLLTGAIINQWSEKKKKKTTLRQFSNISRQLEDICKVKAPLSIHVLSVSMDGNFLTISFSLENVDLENFSMNKTHQCQRWNSGQNGYNYYIIYLGLWATKSSKRGPCPWQQGWN